jgi:protein-disulfide isomerase
MQQQMQASDTGSITSNTDLYPSLGPSNAKATVIEVADFQCPWCTLASGVVDYTKAPWSQLAAQSGDLAGAGGKAEQLAQQGDIRFIFVPMSFLGQESIYAAEAAYCAKDQGKFWEMHDAIYTASDGPSEETGKYTKANLEVIAKSISGLDQNKFKTCLESDTNLAKVQQATQGAGAITTGTPAFFVNGQKVQPSWTAIQAAINAA